MRAGGQAHHGAADDIGGRTPGMGALIAWRRRRRLCSRLIAALTSRDMDAPPEDGFDVFVLFAHGLPLVLSSEIMDAGGKAWNIL